MPTYTITYGNTMLPDTDPHKLTVLKYNRVRAGQKCSNNVMYRMTVHEAIILSGMVHHNIDCHKDVKGGLVTTYTITDE